MRVSTTEFISGFDDVSHRAESEPVTITVEGRDRLVLVSIEEYERLSRGDCEDIAPSSADRPRKDILALWGAMRGTVSWDTDDDITAPTGEVWKAEL